MPLNEQESLKLLSSKDSEYLGNLKIQIVVVLSCDVLCASLEGLSLHGFLGNESKIVPSIQSLLYLVLGTVSVSFFKILGNLI